MFTSTPRPIAPYRSASDPRFRALALEVGLAQCDPASPAASVLLDEVLADPKFVRSLFSNTELVTRYADQLRRLTTGERLPLAQHGRLLKLSEQASDADWESYLRRCRQVLCTRNDAAYPALFQREGAIDVEEQRQLDWALDIARQIADDESDSMSLRKRKEAVSQLALRAAGRLMGLQDPTHKLAVEEWVELCVRFVAPIYPLLLLYYERYCAKLSQASRDFRDCLPEGEAFFDD